MAENIAGLFEQFSRIIPIAGEAITDFGESNALFAYAEGEEGCVTLTPETEKDRLVLQRAFLSLILNEFSPEQIDTSDNETLFEDNLILFNRVLEKSGISYVSHGVCDEMFLINSEGDDIELFLKKLNIYLDFSTLNYELLESNEISFDLSYVDNYIGYFIESDIDMNKDSSYFDSLYDFMINASYSYNVTPRAFGFTTVPIYGNWNNKKGYLLFSMWNMPAEWYSGKAPLSSIDLCELGHLLLSFPKLKAIEAVL